MRDCDVSDRNDAADDERVATGAVVRMLYLSATAAPTVGTTCDRSATQTRPAAIRLADR